MDETNGEGPNPSGHCRCGCGRRTPIAPKTDRAKRWVRGAPLRFRPGHQHRRAGTRYALDPATGCWLWDGAADGPRPGLTVAGRRVDAGRAVWEAERGPLPAGVRLVRTCGRRRCVRPDHAAAVPHAEASRRTAARLADADVRAILAVGADEPLAAVAARFGVGASTVHLIQSGKRHAALAPELPRPRRRDA